MGKKQFVTFYIDEFFLGIDITKVREINRVLEITEVPQAPGYVIGLINLRGQTVTVFDLGVRLGLESRMITDHSHNIIFKNETIGLLVDHIGDVVSVDEEKIEPPPANTGSIEAEFLEGVVEFGNELLMILAAPKIVSAEEGQGE